jgi:hypothetical protein
LPAIASLCGFPRVIADLDRLSTPLKLGPFELSLVPFSPQHGHITRLGVRKVESKNHINQPLTRGLIIRVFFWPW